MINKLMHRISRDEDFLRESLERCAQADDFLAGLLNVLNQTSKSAQRVELGWLRSDYMATDRHSDSIASSCKQVEVRKLLKAFSSCTRARKGVLFQEFVKKSHIPLVRE